jgi:hypothetical protein
MLPPRRRSFPGQPQLLFPDPDRADLWAGLSPEQRQTCRALISQLLQQVLSEPDPAEANEERSDARERQA